MKRTDFTTTTVLARLVGGLCAICWAIDVSSKQSLDRTSVKLDQSVPRSFSPDLGPDFASDTPSLDFVANYGRLCPQSLNACSWCSYCQVCIAAARSDAAVQGITESDWSGEEAIARASRRTGAQGVGLLLYLVGRIAFRRRRYIKLHMSTSDSDTRNRPLNLLTGHASTCPISRGNGRALETCPTIIQQADKGPF